MRFFPGLAILSSICSLNTLGVVAGTIPPPNAFNTTNVPNTSNTAGIIIVNNPFLNVFTDFLNKFTADTSLVKVRNPWGAHPCTVLQGWLSSWPPEGTAMGAAFDIAVAADQFFSVNGMPDPLNATRAASSSSLAESMAVITQDGNYGHAWIKQLYNSSCDTNVTYTKEYPGEKAGRDGNLTYNWLLPATAGGDQAVNPQVLDSMPRNTTAVGNTATNNTVAGGAAGNAAMNPNVGDASEMGIATAPLGSASTPVSSNTAGAIVRRRSTARITRR